MAISNAFSSARVAAGFALETLYEQPQAGSVKGRPVKIYAMGLAAADKTSVTAEPYEFVSLADTGTKFGYDSTLYQICNQLRPANAVGIDSSTELVLFPCDVTTGVQAAGDVTPSGTATAVETYTVKVGNIASLDITTAVGDTVATWIDKAVTACNGVLDFPMTAADGTTTLDLTAGVEGAAGNKYVIEVVSPTDPDFTFTYTQPTGGSGTVDTAAALTAIGDNWYSHLINGVDDVTNTTLLDALSAFGEQRWTPEIARPIKCYTGTNEGTLATVTTITDARKSDRTNSIKHNPASNDIPWVIAARLVAYQAVKASSDPAMDYVKTLVSGLTIGTAANQLDSAARQTAVTKGLSTLEVADAEIRISDSVMCYHPDGEDPPAYRYDCDIEKLSAMMYNIKNIFESPSDAGNPLVPDAQTVTNPNARKPSYFKRKLFSLYEAAGEDAIISDVDYAKENTLVEISGSNPKRLDVLAVFKLSGNVNVISVTQKFSFYLG